MVLVLANQRQRLGGRYLQGVVHLHRQAALETEVQIEAEEEQGQP